jgi:hypothetical protein
MKPDGKKAVIVMTDGIDNSSRRRVDEVIARAKEAGVPLFMVGFGRDERNGKKELDVKLMGDMAKKTGGEFYHARNKDALKQIFTSMSLHLHSDGINEQALKKVAEGTGGEYHPAKDVEKLKSVVGDVVVTVMKELPPFTIQFRSNFPSTGTIIPVTLEPVLRGTDISVGKGQEAGVQTHGLIIADMNHFVYLGILAIVGALIAIPAGLRRLTKPAA